MAAAIYRAANDGADVINLSIGGGPNYAQDVSGVAAAKVGERGVCT
jgi:subtilisin family serine protease